MTSENDVGENQVIQSQSGSKICIPEDAEGKHRAEQTQSEMDTNTEGRQSAFEAIHARIISSNAA